MLSVYNLIAEKKLQVPDNISFDELCKKELEDLNKLSRDGTISSAEKQLLKEYTGAITFAFDIEKKGRDAIT